MRKVEIAVYVAGVIGIVVLAIAHNIPGVIWAVCATLWARNAFSYEKRYEDLKKTLEATR